MNMKNSTVLTDEQKHNLNYDVISTEQEDAAKKLKKLGVKAEQVQVIMWKVNGEYLSPRMFVDRVEKGYYGSKEKVDERGTDAEVVVQPHKGRPSRPVATESRGVRGDTGKRESGQGRQRGNGRGSSKAVLGRDSNLKAVARAEAALVRKSSSSIPDRAGNNSADETRVAKTRKPRSDKGKSRGTRKPDTSRQKALRRKNTARISAKTRVRSRRS